MKKKKTEFILSKPNFILGTMVLISVLFVILINRLNIVPNKFLIVIVVAIGFLNAIVAQGLVRKKVAKKNLYKVAALILSVSLIVSSFYIVKGSSFLDQITGANKSIYNVAIIVKEDSPYESVSDVKDLVFGFNEMQDQKSIDKAIPLIKDEYKFTPRLREFSDFEDLGNNLLNETIEVALISEAHIATVNDIIDGFETEIRILGMVSYEEELGVETPNVNISSDTYSVFLTGIDTYGTIASVSRSDVNMIITVSPSSGEILLTSIPRDYHVELGTIGKMDKLTHAGKYGVKESITTLEKLLNIDIDYFLKVNFSSVERIVDALGGVDVYSKYSFTTLHGKFPITSGMNHLNGKQALGFVRERYSLPNGDNDRVVNQQELLEGILNKIVSPKIITNFSSILNSVSGAIQTNMPSATLSGIIKNQLDKNTAWKISQYSLTGFNSSSTTAYSMPGRYTYVMEPNWDTVNKASNLILELEKTPN